MNLRVLSIYDLDRQISSDGATWLDRELVSPIGPRYSSWVWK